MVGQGARYVKFIHTGIEDFCWYGVKGKRVPWFNNDFFSGTRFERIAMIVLCLGRARVFL